MLFSLFIVMILQMQQVEEAEFDEERPLLAQIEVEDDPESPMITAPGSPINVD